MGFNDLFCLGHAEVHTLSIGAARPSDFDEHLAILPLIQDAMIGLGPVMKRLEDAAVRAMGADWAATWRHGLPTTIYAPHEIPLYHILRMYTMAKAYDMVGYGKMRYNLLGGGDHWFPGHKLIDVDWDALLDELKDYHFADRVPEILQEAHELFNAEDKKRLSESGD